MFLEKQGLMAKKGTTSHVLVICHGFVAGESYRILLEHVFEPMIDGPLEQETMRCMSNFKWGAFGTFNFK